MLPQERSHVLTIHIFIYLLVLCHRLFISSASGYETKVFKTADTFNFIIVGCDVGPKVGFVHGHYFNKTTTMKTKFGPQCVYMRTASSPS